MHKFISSVWKSNYFSIGCATLNYVDFYPWAKDFPIQGGIIMKRPVPTIIAGKMLRGVIYA